MPAYQLGKIMENGEENGSQDNLRVDQIFEWWSSIPRMVGRNTGLISIGESHFYDLDDEWNRRIIQARPGACH